MDDISFRESVAVGSLEHREGRSAPCAAGLVWMAGTQVYAGAYGLWRSPESS